MAKATKIILQRNLFQKENKVDIFVDNKEVLSSVEVNDEDIEEFRENIIHEIEKTYPAEDESLVEEEIKQLCNFEGKINIVNVKIEVDKIIYKVNSIPYKQIYVDHNHDKEFIRRFVNYLSKGIIQIEKEKFDKQKIKVIEVAIVSNTIGLETFDKKHGKDIQESKRLRSKGVQRKTKKETKNK